MTVAAGHLGRPQSQLGGPVSPARYTLPPPLYIVLPNLGPAPILSGVEQPPNIEVVSLSPGLSLARHPSPYAAPRRSVLPHSTLLFVRAGQSNPSSCRLNLHTKDQCKDHQLCGYKSRVHSKTTHRASTQIRVYLALMLFLKI